MLTRLQDLRRLFAAPSLPASAKLSLLWFKMRKRMPAPPRMFALRLGAGTIFLDATTPVALALINEVFVTDAYATDYRRAVVIDAGAHRGYFAAYALLNGAAAVFAFEPDEDNFTSLKATADSFEGAGYRLVPCRKAIAARAGYVDFYVTDQSWSHSTYRRSDRVILRAERIPACAFDEAILEAKTLGGPQARLLVKMDVEGGEGDILLNTSMQALAEVDEMFVELHEFGGYSAARLVDYLGCAGLKLMTERAAGIIHVKRAR